MGRASVSKTDEKRSSRLRSATLWPRSLVVRILAFQAVGRSVQIRPGLPFSYIALIEYRLVHLTLNQESRVRLPVGAPFMARSSTS